MHDPGLRLSIITVVMFVAFIGMVLILYLPRKDPPYKDAEKLALKEDDQIIQPRHPQEHHKR